MSAKLIHFQFDQASSGRWVYVSAEGQQHDNVMAVRSFPVASPDEGIAIVDADGKELLWIAHLNTLSEAVRAQILKAMNQREFMPEILKLYGVSGFIAPSTWDIETDRGRTKLLLKGRGHSPTVWQSHVGDRWSWRAVFDSGYVSNGPSFPKIAR